VQESGVAAQRGSSPAETLAHFEGVVDSVKHPPGPNTTWLGEVIVHAEDIRRPLGIKHSYPTDAVVAVAHFYQGSNMLIGSKRRISGLTLVQDVPRIHAQPGQQQHRVADPVQHEPGEQLDEAAWHAATMAKLALRQ